MEKNRDYCFRHAKMYEGYQCPFCAEEEDRRKAGAVPRTTQAPAGAVAPGSEAAAGGAYHPPSRAESRAKSEQAEAMLVSGAAREALELCDAAVDRDPRNLHAHIVGARASRILHETPREMEFLEETVKLLRSDEYARTGQWYHEVLKHARDSALVSQVARSFVAAKKWPAAETLTLVRALVGRGAVSDALVVLDSLAPTDRSLLTCAYSMQLTGAAYNRVDPDLVAYLEATPAERRAQVLKEMHELRSSDVISGLTTAKVRDAVRKRYEEWAPEIKHAISEEARTVAADRVAQKANGPAMAAAIKFFLGALVVTVVLALALGGGVLSLGLGAVVALACAGAGFAYGRDVELKKLIPTVLPEVKEELTTREVQRWEPILSEEHDTGEQAPPPATEACPYCGATVVVGAAACPQCAHSLQPEPPPEATAEGAPPTEIPETPAGEAVPDAPLAPERAGTPDA